jgi:uncharacterized protein
VGILSNSHKAVLNLMAEVCKVGGDAVRGTKVGGKSDDPVLQAWPQLAYEPSSEAGEGSYPGEMVGGTAWFFARPGMAGALDYLFVDEAGQVSVANLVGAARSARNLVLLGDQMQLGQPIQGVHPGESGLSVLEYYLAGQATIPSALGLFLGTSRRMHPAVCQFISDAVYEGRLGAEPGNERRIIRRPPGSAGLIRRDAGLQFIAVEHEGNSQASDEEIATIRRLVQELAGCEHTGRDGRSLGRLDPSRDILIVAPYNLQVSKLIAALPDQMKIGTVDKFQGQEAPVVIVSMCTSAGEEGGRGLKFVLDQNRLNVAISRAQSLALVVGDPRLVEAGANSVDDMRRLNLYCWIQDVGRPD